MSAKRHIQWALTGSRKLMGIVAILVFSVLLILVFGALGFSRDRAFSISAATEIVSVTFDDDFSVSAKLPDVSIVSGTTVLRKVNRATLKIRGGASVSLSRKREGALLIAFSSGGEEEAAILVLQNGEEVPVRGDDILRISLLHPSSGSGGDPQGESAILPFRGRLRVGSDIAPLADHALLAGTVQIVERQPFSGERFVVTEAKLDTGDTIEWIAMGKHDPPSTAGFIYAGDGGALRVIAHAVADHVRIDRFGAAPYDIKPTPWEQLAHDPIVGAATIGMTLLGVLLGLLALEFGFIRTSTTQEKGGAKDAHIENSHSARRGDTRH